MGRNGEKADCNLQTNRGGLGGRPTHIYRAAQKVCLGFGDCPQILATCERAEWQGIHRSAFRQLMQLLYVSFLESRTSLFVHLCISTHTDRHRQTSSEMGKDHDLWSWSSRSPLVISIFWLVKITSGDLFKWSWSSIFDLRFFEITFHFNTQPKQLNCG